MSICTEKNTTLTDMGEPAFFRHTIYNLLISSVVSPVAA